MDTVVSLITTIIPFLFVLTLVVAVHEYGHYLAGRIFKTKIDAFSIGFGQKLFGRTDKNGVEWKVCALPLGGYVKFSGDINAASVPDKSHLEQMRDHIAAEEGEAAVKDYYHFKPVWQRIIIAAAGPMANYLLAIVIFAALFMTLGREVTEARVDQVVPESAAEAAGFQSGDVILEANGRSINSFSDLQEIVAYRAGAEIDFQVRRDGQVVELQATPERKVVTDRFGYEHKIGVLGISRSTQGSDIQRIHYGPIDAVAEGAKRTWQVTTETLGYLKRIILGIAPADQLSGPLGIAKITGQTAEAGLQAGESIGEKLSMAFIALIHLSAILSVSIGMLNLFPIPMLDGGHIVFYTYEAVRGKPLPERVQNFGFQVGLVMILGLMVFATWNDLVNLKVIDALRGLVS